MTPKRSIMATLIGLVPLIKELHSLPIDSPASAGAAPISIVARAPQQPGPVLQSTIGSANTGIGGQCNAYTKWPINDSGTINYSGGQTITCPEGTGYDPLSFGDKDVCTAIALSTCHQVENMHKQAMQASSAAAAAVPATSVAPVLGQTSQAQIPAANEFLQQPAQGQGQSQPTPAGQKNAATGGANVPAPSAQAEQPPNPSQQPAAAPASNVGSALGNPPPTGNSQSQSNPPPTGNSQSQSNPPPTGNSQSQSNPPPTGNSQSQSNPPPTGNSQSQSNPPPTGNSQSQSNPPPTGNSQSQSNPPPTGDSQSQSNPPPTDNSQSQGSFQGN